MPSWPTEFIFDDGSTFKAPLEKVWQLNQSEGEHSHPSLRNQSGDQQGEHFILSYETKVPDGSWAKNKVMTTAFPPVEVAFETIEGPMAVRSRSSSTRPRATRPA